MFNIISRIILILFFPTILLCSSLEEEHYIEYHKAINKAEDLFFCHNMTDSSLHIYDQVFNDYSFLFVKDVLIAAQIAYFNQRPFRKYLVLGFKFGLKLDHLENIELFKPVYQLLKLDYELLELFNRERKEYLSSIDYEYLLSIYNMSIHDQINKNDKDLSYANFKKECISKIIKMILDKGFPGSKMIGIDDNNIFREIGHPEYDFNYLKNKSGHNLSYFKLEEESFTATTIMTILIHNGCAYDELKPYFENLIDSGLIHPRQIALMNDNKYRNVNSSYYKCSKHASPLVFKINPFVNYSMINHSRELTNKHRLENYMCSLEVDEAKKMFQNRFGFKLFFGFWSCL
jgi:hypothetical protein